MGLLSALKEWSDSMNDFYANPRLMLHRPSCDGLEAKLNAIIEWLNRNSEVVNLSNKSISPFGIPTGGNILEQGIAAKFGRKRYTMSKDKIKEFKSLCNSFIEVAQMTKTEIELIQVRAAGMPHVIGDAEMYRRIQGELGGKYYELVTRFELITKNIYVKG